MKLFFRQFGTGEHIVILHGFLGSSDNWATLGKKLAERYSVWLVDQRNHGQSPHSEEFNYQTMVTDLREFFQDNGIDKANIIGHSMGGKTAMLFAETHPELVQRLVVVDIAPRYYPVHHRTILAGLRAVQLATNQNRNEAEHQMMPFLPEFSTRQFLLKSLYRPAQGGFAWRFNLDVLEREIEQVGQDVHGKFQFDGPTLFIRGGKSDYIGENDTSLIFSRFPSPQIETIADAGHWIHADQPDAFLEHVSRFLGMWK